MKVFIKVLDVKDGDAIILHLKKEAGELVGLIDSGRQGNHELVLAELTKILEISNKKSPDFILCTHYDEDHIGGLSKIIETFKHEKPLVWMHKTSEKIDIEEFKRHLDTPKEEDSIFPNESDSYLGGNFGTDQKYYEQAIKNVEREKAIIKLVRDLDMTCQEPLAENFKIDGWPELSIISPTIELYQKLFSEKFSVEEFLESTVQQLKADDNVQLDPSFEDPFEALDRIKKTKITATNMNSAILLLKIGDKKFVFAADAGLEAFNYILDDTIKDLYWLKVPHHGSLNNIDARLIKLMRPYKAVISGSKLISQEVVACLKVLGSEILTTKDNGHIVFDETI